jgi:hypothetical protein
MDQKIIKSLIVLGVPGVALGVFLLLMKSFSFNFSEIPPVLSGVIAILFLVLVGGVTVFALHRWSPERGISELRNERSEEKDEEKPFTLRVGEVVVTYEEKMRSMGMDVVKINAHDHIVGVRAEYAWLAHYYPNYERKQQALTTLELMTGSEGEYHDDQIQFDCLSIKLEDGRQKDVYFDVSQFFRPGGFSSLIDRDGFAAKKLTEIYA